MMKQLSTYAALININCFKLGLLVVCLFTPTISPSSNLNLTGYIDEINLEAQKIKISGNSYHIDSATKVIAKENAIGHELLQQGMNINYKIDSMTAIHSQPSIQEIHVMSPISIHQLNQ